MIILLFLFIILVALTVRKSHMGLGWYFVIRLVIPPSARLIGLSFNTICLATFVLLLLIYHYKEVVSKSVSLRVYTKQITFLFVGLTLLTIFADIVPWLFQIKALTQFFITEFVPSILVIMLVRGRAEMNSVIKLVACGALFNCAYGVLTFFIPSNPVFDKFTSLNAADLALVEREEGRFGLAAKAEGIYGKLNGKIVLSLVSMLIFSFFYNKTFLSKFLRYCVLISSILACALTTQRSGLFGILIFLLVMTPRKFLFRYIKKYAVYGVIAVVFVFSLPQLQVLKDMLLSVVFLFDDARQETLGAGGSSMSMRFMQMGLVWDYVKDYVLQGVGYGFAQYRIENESLNVDGLYGIESYFLKTLICSGIIGCILWFRFFYYFVKNSKKNLSQMGSRYLVAFNISYIFAILLTDTAGTFFLYLLLACLNAVYMRHYDNAQISKL